jgi:GMP synthase-like glutamine amidotransferase
LEFRWREATSIPKLALAIRHVHFEDCGSLTEALLENNFAIRSVALAKPIIGICLGAQMLAASLAPGLAQKAARVFNDWLGATVTDAARVT